MSKGDEAVAFTILSVNCRTASENVVELVTFCHLLNIVAESFIHQLNLKSAGELNIEIVNIDSAPETPIFVFFNDFDKRTDAVDSWIWLVQFPFTVGAHPVYFPDFM